MDLTQRLNEIKALYGTSAEGVEGAALAAKVLLDENNEVVFDAHDLPGTMARLHWALAREDQPAMSLDGSETIGIVQNWTILQLSLGLLRSWISGQFGVRLQSTGATPDIAQTRKLLETGGASPTNPYLVLLDQLILTPFTGPGQFDLVERDASDVDLFFPDCITVNASPLLASVGDDFTADMVGDIVTMAGVPPGTTVLSYQNPKQVTLSANATADAPAPGIGCTIGGKTQVTLATKAGFTNGDTTGTWSRLVKAVTSDKIYSVVFVPGTAGDGIFSMRARGLNQG